LFVWRFKKDRVRGSKEYFSLGFFVCLIGIGKGNPYIFFNVYWWDLEFNDLSVTCEFQFLVGFFSIFFLVRFSIEGFRCSFSPLRLWDLHLGLCFCDWILNLCCCLFFFFFVREMAGSDENNPGGIGLTNFQGTRPGFGCEISMLRL
jgi:hypothetical protein